MAPNAMDDPEAPWAIIDSYFKHAGLDRLVRHQVESYNDFVTHQIPATLAMFNPVHARSDNDFVPECGKYRLEVWVRFTDFRAYRPQIHENTGASKPMMPSEARLRNFSYSAAMTVDLQCRYVIRTGPDLGSEQTIHKTIPSVPLGKLPVMLRSSICVLDQYRHVGGESAGECSVDPGGYFIVNGSEKTCVAQERPAENMVACYPQVRSATKGGWVAEFKAVPDTKCISPKQVTLATTTRSGRTSGPVGVTVSLNRLKNPVPLAVVFRALGVRSDAEMCSYIVFDIAAPDAQPLLDACEGIILDGCDYPDSDSAISHLVGQALYSPFMGECAGTPQARRTFALDVLKSDLFPHCRTDPQRLHLLGYMAHRLLLCHLGRAPGADRDSYMGKRVDLTGTLLNNLFRNYVNKLVKDMQKHIVREINNGSWRTTDDYANIINATNIYKIVKSPTIENGLKRALSTGDFGIKHANTSKVGVAQVMKRLTTADGLSHLRRVNTPIDKSGKLIPPRKLHSTSWGFLCPAETPEGHSVGVVKNLSYLTHVTTCSDPAPIYAAVTPHIVPVEDAAPRLRHAGVKVFVNGCWLGMVDDPTPLYREAKRLKRHGVLNSYTSITLDVHSREMHLCSDAGRLTRPLLIVEDGKLLITPSHIERLRGGELTWDDLMTGTAGEPVIEYLDAAEQAMALVAMRPRDLEGSGERFYRHTHCEIHPSTIFGLLASCIPFPEHNQSPRNTYQCAMGKQAIGTYATNYYDRLDKTSYVLTYPTRPLVDTRVMQYMGVNAVPSGTQVMVAIMTHTGYNQEDSILFNRGSLDRGLFQATVFQTEKDEDKKVHGDEELRIRPDPAKTRGMKLANYSKLTPEGLVPENTLLSNRDIIIGKALPIRGAKNDATQVAKYTDQSRIFRTTEDAYVDKNFVGRNGDGYQFCKTRIRTTRKPVIGDKFSSRHGQKGTIGNIIPEADMPFTAEGLRPDLIINPHAIPSRMTIAQLKETVLGKALIALGMFGDGTSFGELGIETICEELCRLGFESTGNELLYDGETGVQISTSIFIGPVFYQRLKHMVNDKQHSRASGPMVSLTRQPAEGRSRDGGLRYGEMERDCMCSHGAARFNKERIYDASDSYSVHVCRPCGLIAAYNDAAKVHHCRVCDNRVDFARVNVPYAFKLLSQELTTMNVAPRLMVE